MTRDEAIEAGARAIHAASGMATEWDAPWPANRDWYRASAAAVLDAIGWAEPAGYVIAVDDRDRPGTIFGSTWPDLASARAYAEPGERVWGLVPVEVGE